jgi:hypothetical protein
MDFTMKCFEFFSLMIGLDGFVITDFFEAGDFTPHF